MGLLLIAGELYIDFKTLVIFFFNVTSEWKVVSVVPAGKRSIEHALCRVLE